MILDSRTITPDTVLETDICVVGAGAAGITLALQFANSALRVDLVESGGFVFDDATQDLARGEVRNGRYRQLNKSRMRHFGGVTTVWGGQSLPLGEIDFEKRDGIPDSGWPITRADLDPFYVRAHEVLKLGPFDYDVARAAADRGLDLFPFDRSRVDTVLSRYRPLRFGPEYRETLEQAPNIRILLHGNLVNIDRDRDRARIAGLSIRTLTGTAFTMRARYYVIALGGIENARALLLSRDVEAAGLGNRHDLVGRFFMEHVSYQSGYLLPADPGTAYRLYTKLHPDPAGHDIQAHIALPQALVRELAIPNYRAILTYKSDASQGRPAKKDRKQKSSEQRSDGFFAQIGRMIGDLIDQEGDAGGELDDAYRLRSYVEQVPDRDSRVGLADTRDALGLNRVYADWRLSEANRRGIKEALQVIAAEAGRSGFGRARIDVDEGEPVLDGARGSHHHMGTTRMHDDPKHGVVDPDCRVHGVENLYVAGSSVFPTSGHANPTMTIVALTLRLADHIRSLAVRAGGGDGG